MWVVPVTLSGRVVRLEPLELRHAPGLFEAAEPDLFVHTPQAPSVAGFEADVRHVNSLLGVVAFAMVSVADGKVMGRTTFMDIQPDHKGLEIGRTWIARGQQGTAVNPEVKYLMLRHAFGTLQAIRVQFTTGSTNLHSQRAIAKLGAMREGLLRRNRLLPNGGFRDTVYYSILADEWPAVRRGLEQRLGWAPGAWGAEA